jgi:hypothetical protein
MIIISKSITHPAARPQSPPNPVRTPQQCSLPSGPNKLPEGRVPFPAPAGSLVIEPGRHSQSGDFISTSGLHEPLYAVIRPGQVFLFFCCLFCHDEENYVCGQAKIRLSSRRSVQRAKGSVAACPAARGVSGHDDVGIPAVCRGVGNRLFRSRRERLGLAPVGASTQAPLTPKPVSDPVRTGSCFAPAPAGGLIANEAEAGAVGSGRVIPFFPFGSFVDGRRRRFRHAPILFFMSGRKKPNMPGLHVPWKGRIMERDANI